MPYELLLLIKTKIIYKKPSLVEIKSLTEIKYIQKLILLVPKATFLIFI